MSTIAELLEDERFTPDDVERLKQAFAQTLKSLRLAERIDDPLCEIVARKVINVYISGIHDPAQIADVAVRLLGLP